DRPAGATGRRARCCRRWAWRRSYLPMNSRMTDDGATSDPGLGIWRTTRPIREESATASLVISPNRPSAVSLRVARSRVYDARSGTIGPLGRVVAVAGGGAALRLNAS